MTSASKLIQASAGNAAGAGLAVEDVFSTYLWTGTGSEEIVTNNIDLDGEEGIVWTKKRSTTGNNDIFYKNSGSPVDGTSRLSTNLTSAENNGYTGNLAVDFLSDGFSFGSTLNTSGTTFASWTFRKAPKFFDVVTYTGNGVAGRTVSHNLGSVPGCIIVKRTDSAASWYVYHRSNTASPETDYLRLDLTAATVDDSSIWDDTVPTSTNFTVGYGGEVNLSGATYVAYLFAHNDGDGEFGEDADQDIIKCGSYTGNGSADGPEIDLGFEPQWVMIKATGLTRNWVMGDVMRGAPVSSNGQRLAANLSDAELTEDTIFAPTSTGFKLRSNSGTINDNGETYIYIAIRRGPMKTPESGTEVFAVTKGGGDSDTNFVVDLNLSTKTTSYSNYAISRLTGIGKYLITNGTDAESSTGLSSGYDKLGIDLTAFHGTSADLVYWNFRRAPGFFDVVAYTGTGVAGRTVSHNLGVAPELMIVKHRSLILGNPSYNQEWSVYSSELNQEAYLNETTQFFSDSSYPSVPTASEFTVGSGSKVNHSGVSFIAYLFATLPGVSKVGSYTGNGSSQTIDCGFSTGARFVLTKRTNSTGNWNVWDSERGIVAGNDPRLELNTTDAEDTGHDYIDPDSSGFIVNYVADDDDDSNVSGDEYIFLAIS